MSLIPKKWRTAIFNYLGGDAININPPGRIGVPVLSEPMDSPFLMDFRNDRFGSPAVQSTNMTFGETSMVMVNGNGGYGGLATTGDVPKGAVRVEVSPKSVVDELKRPPTMMSLDGLDGKLAILKMKKDLISQRYSAEHVTGMIQALEMRKKYDEKSKVAKRTYREFFSRYDTTDESKIEALTTKYELVAKDADLFIPEFPDEAIETMDLYTKVVQELTGKKPRFYVIAKAKDFRDAFNKRDPILYATSPFGMFYYILGAWEEEMLYLPEL